MSTRAAGTDRMAAGPEAGTVAAEAAPDAEAARDAEAHLARTGLTGVPPLPPLDPADEEAITLMGLLVEVHAKLVRMLGTQMEESCGLPLSWYDAMIRLRRSPGGFTTMTRLGGEVSLTSGGITRLVDRLVEAGYAERSSCPTDRRSVYVRLTPAGVRKVDEATAAHRSVLEAHLLGPLSPADRRALEAVLRTLRRG